MDSARLLAQPGHRTNRFALPGGGLHHDRGGWIAVQTPANPTFWYGHRLILPASPWVEGVAVWRRRWLAENPDPQRRPPRAYLSWECPAPDPESVARATDEEIALDEQVIRVHRGPPPQLPPPPPGLALRPLVGDAEWGAIITISARAFDDPIDFLSWDQTDRRARVERGLGVEWGAFLDGRLVGHCGLMWGEGEARFQDVAVDPAAQGRRIAAYLIAAALADHAVRHPGAPAWIVAELDSRAGRIYEALGFVIASWGYDLALPITDRSR